MVYFYIELVKPTFCINKKGNLYYDTVFDRYRDLWNIGHCFGVNYLLS